MITKLKLTLLSLTKIFRCPTKRPIRWQNRCHPSLEPLEARLVPTTYTWRGDGLTENWSDGQNWFRNLNGIDGPGVPSAGDTVSFSNLYGANSNKNSTANAAWLAVWLAAQPPGTVATLDGLNIEGYTGTITLGQGLTVTTFNESSGTITGAFPLTVSGQGVWTGGLCRVISDK